MAQPRTIKKALVSNHYTLSMAPNRLGWLSPSDPGTPKAVLWEQFRACGYLWLKNVLDRKEVLAFRRRFMAAFAEADLLAEGSDPLEGIFSGHENKGVAAHKLHEAVRWAAYEAFCLSAPVWQFYQEVLGGPPYLHKRKILRYTRPGDPSCTGAHYDLTYLRAGTDRVYTSWIPIGDIPVEMGGLVYLEGSDAAGRRLEAEFSAGNQHLAPEDRISAYNKNMSEAGWITKDLPGLADRLSSRWLMADYEAGDMMIHSAYMIHAATTNEDPGGRIRVSTDIRYQLVTDAIDQRWSQHWSVDDRL